jgi:hypothetical protein
MSPSDCGPVTITRVTGSSDCAEADATAVLDDGWEADATAGLDDGWEDGAVDDGVDGLAVLPVHAASSNTVDRMASGRSLFMNSMLLLGWLTGLVVALL